MASDRMRDAGRFGVPEVLLLALAFALGTFLRVYLLPSQILLDDEWHGLNQVVTASLGEVLSGFDGKDNTSLPLNLYHWILLHTAGWSELPIRLPALVAGILAVLVLPLSVRGLLGRRAAVVFAFLLAIAPFAVFYSRFSRAYSIVLLLGFLALMAAHRWLASGNARALASFIAAGTLAAYFHPLAGIAIAVPFAAGAVVVGAPQLGSSWGRVAVTGPGLKRAAVIQGLLLVPLALMMIAASGRMPWGGGEWSLAGVREAAVLLGGTASGLLSAAYVLVAVAGFFVLYRTHRLLFALYAGTLALYGAALATGRPFGMETGVVLLRYAIVLVPVVLSAAAVCVDAAMARFPASGKVGRFAFVPGFALLAVLIGVGPLPGVYGGTNNFTNHSAYQGSYEPPNVSRAEARHVYPGYPLEAGDIPPYYRIIRDSPDIAAVVEYPMDVTNYNNLFYFYQLHHGKRVIAGYCPERALLGHRALVPDNASPLRLGLLGADQILSHVRDRKKLRFVNMTDMTDPAALEASGASVAVLHKKIMALRFLPGGHDAVAVLYRSVPQIAARLAAHFGEAVYEDDEIVCFRLRKL